MGLRSRGRKVGKSLLKQLLLESAQLRERLMRPVLARRRRRWLEAIRRLERVEELQWHPGTEPAPHPLVLLSHYAPGGHLQRAIRRLIAHLRDQGWQVLILTTALNDTARRWCSERSVHWLIRRNEGRDFGAFQDGWLTLQQRGLAEACSRILLLNDSSLPVADLAGSSLPRLLEGDDDAIVGLTDSFQNGYHLQSYALNCPETVIRSAWWHGFWWSFPGWSGTAGIIRDGEIGLSRQALQAGHPLRALHPVSRLRTVGGQEEFLRRLQERCGYSRHAAQLLQEAVLEQARDAFATMNPTHDLVLPLLLEGCPLIKRDLLESNPCDCLDPSLIAFGEPPLIDPLDLVDFLRPPLIGFKQ
ncbi:hypothetical protein EVJ50_09510 [Synechococcus sp. RSCCF101]|uniref:hypothetical protein n=1 Tax=Synechococcus sp. RSCCF101 TaxID=2511069 RepID=UPI001245A5B4|nr:hypothetical protein [Synechococcus sp. RSCCF101]QEY32418.1 hypothetical protein EVJ50_09510 [Synechococcus sp. RSCCF101]